MSRFYNFVFDQFWLFLTNFCWFLAVFDQLYVLLIFGVIEYDVFESIGLAGGWKLIVSALFFLAGSIIGVYVVWDEYGLVD